MPCIQIRTNVKVDVDQAERIKAGLGRVISMFPGKSEDWLMVVVEDGCRMYFGGAAGKPLAVVEVNILGTKIDASAANEMTKEVTAIVRDNLGVAPDDMYIKYVASPDWGWNGKNF